MRHWVIGQSNGPRSKKITFWYTSTTEEFFERIGMKVQCPIVFAEECESREAAIALYKRYEFREERAAIRWKKPKGW